ncbi:hypothetical protein K2173_000581 [Erythroxylum novogranatense]|uniref:Cytochrome b561 and DOMON domain-containing protein n=1 Tax=Erythroxylum novogranatense TaxID=1862640 RepID=A0AAV8S7Z3_9ROSI|nr:hypothetical protein K2173_000581 [Erythroxylum novogranatense]
MKTSNAFLTVFFALWSLSNIASAQTDSCSSNLNLSGLPFDQSSLHCISVWSSEDYILRYSQASSDTWNFVLSAPDSNSYVAMGFSVTGSMVGSSAVVGWVSPTDGTGVIKQYYLGGQTPSQVVPDQGKLNINSSMILSQSSRLYLAFQLNTAQPSSRQIFSVGPTGFSPSAPSYSLREHREKVQVGLNYVTGQSSVKSSYTSLRRGHGVLNMVGWGILMLIGAMVASFMREWDPLWFYAHMCIQSIGFVLGVVGVICGLVLQNRISAHVPTHKAIGIFILVLGCLQVMAILARPNVSSKVRRYWNWYHHSGGRVLIIFAVANVFYGIHLGGEGRSWNVGYAVVLALLFVVSVVLGVRMWKRK